MSTMLQVLVAVPSAAVEVLCHSTFIPSVRSRNDDSTLGSSLEALISVSFLVCYDNYFLLYRLRGLDVYLSLQPVPDQYAFALGECPVSHMPS